jgi:hypothetical protein
MSTFKEKLEQGRQLILENQDLGDINRIGNLFEKDVANITDPATKVFKAEKDQEYALDISLGNLKTRIKMSREKV